VFPPASSVPAGNAAATYPVKQCRASDTGLIWINPIRASRAHPQNMGNRAANPQQVQADEENSGDLPRVPMIISGDAARRTIEVCERELIQYKAMEIRLRDALAESEARLRQKD
jgi:hypothetical protein